MAAFCGLLNLLFASGIFYAPPIIIMINPNILDRNFFILLSYDRMAFEKNHRDKERA